MDSIVSAARHESVSYTRSLRLFALAAIAAGLTGCGGGGGGGGGGGNNPPPTPTGSIAATVIDQFDAPINGVLISAGGRTATTGSAGTATITQVPTGDVAVTASADGLISPPAQTATVTENGTANVSFTMQRVVEAAGGIRTAQAVGPPNAERSSFTFRLGVIVFDESFTPVTGLPPEAFILPKCELPPAPENPPRAHCVRGIDSPGFDAPYTAAIATPAAPVVPTGPVSYAVGLLFDSSASIADSDPTDARVFATKAYLDNIVTGNSVMLAAFADQDARQLPNEGVNYFPCNPCTPAFISDGNSLFASLDSLATLEGGGTPLYDALATSDGQDGMIVSVDNVSPPTPVDRKAVVLFSDGRDIYCDDPTPPPPKPAGNFGFCVTRRGEVAAEATGRTIGGIL